MREIHFRASGHENVQGTHNSTVEITSETFLTRQGTCIIGVGMEFSLDRIEESMRVLAQKQDTKIRLDMKAGHIEETIIGYGSAGLTYTDPISMVIRKSDFECDRTLMVKANKAAIDLDREFTAILGKPDTELQCRIQFITS